MNIMIAGGAGFLGGSLAQSLTAQGHKVFILSRRSQNDSGPVTHVKWNGRDPDGWGHLMNEMDAVINLAGRSLSSWPWTARKKQDFLDSRIIPSLALVEAIKQAERRPKTFVQVSGINYYGLKGPLADESTPPGNDYLAQLALKWEEPSKSLEALGVRCIIARTSVVLGRNGGLLSMISLPIRLFAGGPLGDGRQALPWIHIQDWIGAILFLLDHETAAGPYNLTAPVSTSNSEFNRLLANVLNRPYWLRVPGFLLRILLGEMSVLILDGRFSQPRRLIKAGYKFQYGGLREALANLYLKSSKE